MKRERLTITCDAELLRAVDETVDGALIRNRSHAIESLIARGLALDSLTTLVVLPGEPVQASPFPQIHAFLSGTTVTQALVLTDPTRPAWASEAAAQLSPLSTQSIPGEFGLSAALTLVRAQLSSPVLLIKLSPELNLPGSPLPLYSHHLRSGKLLTHLLTETLAPSGVSVLSPEGLDLSPATPDLFSSLAKIGKVGAYVSA
jgi:hypothetical protein